MPRAKDVFRDPGLVSQICDHLNIDYLTSDGRMQGCYCSKYNKDINLESQAVMMFCCTKLKYTACPLGAIEKSERKAENESYNSNPQKVGATSPECDRRYLDMQNVRDVENERRNSETYDESIREMKALEKEKASSAIDYEILADQWDSLANNFDAINHKDSASLKSICRKHASKARSQANSLETMKKTANNLATLLQLALSVAYLFLLFVTDIVRQHSLWRIDRWNDWIWPGLLRISIPLGVFAIIIGLISILFLRKSFRGSGSQFIFWTGLIQSVALGFWIIDEGIVWGIAMGVAMLVCGLIISIPGYILASSEK